MRDSTVTKAIYAYYEFSILGDPVIFYSSLLIVLALIISFVQRGSATSRSAKVSGTPRIPKKIKLDRNGKIIIYSFLGFVIFLGLVIPISVLSFWLFRGIY